VAQVERRPEVPIELAGIELVDADDRPVVLGELWAEQTVVLIHLRHFGCILCRHYAGALRDFHADFEALGVRLVAIGTGGRQYARDFVAERKIPYQVLVDRHMASYDVIRVKQGPFVGILKPRVVWAAIKAWRVGERQGKTGPNPFKFGAAHVIGPGNVLHYAWINDDYHDNTPVEELLGIAAAAAGGGSHQQVGAA
jgi:peroxiredoxin